MAMAVAVEQVRWAVMVPVGLLTPKRKARTAQAGPVVVLQLQGSPALGHNLDIHQQ
jgi:hypothetical protein